MERLNYLLEIAIKYHVSDIHFNYDNKLNELISIDMRVNDEIRRVKRESDDSYLFRYLMYLSNLDISNLMNPQTGNFQININGVDLSLRFAVISTVNNTNGVLRILNSSMRLCIDNLTRDVDDIKWLKEIKNHNEGLFVFSGPTGSGKTTTLYTILNEIDNKKIFTLEDPIEVMNDKFIQIQINEKMNLNYASGIKQLMRHDPDIIMIGEIRDDEAAKMAVRCALTGHLVITSLHSSSCISAINRLLDLGVQQYQLEDILMGITSQRLLMNDNDEYLTVYEIFKRGDIEEYFRSGGYLNEHKRLNEKIEALKKDGYH